MQGVRVERLDHLGIVASMCSEIGLAEYLDAVARPSEQQVSIGTAMVAMILNGLGFSNRRLYLVSQFFATKPVEHLLGAGITAQMLHDDCLGRTLDRLYEHDPAAPFAGINPRVLALNIQNQAYEQAITLYLDGEWRKRADTRTYDNLSYG